MTSNTCTDPITELLVPLAQGQLGADDSGRVLDHVEGCPACSTELDFLADLVTAAGSDVADVAPRSTGKLLRFPYKTLGTLAAAAAVLFLVVPMFFTQDVSVAPYADYRRPAYTPQPDIRSENLFKAAMAGYSEGRNEDVERALTELIDAPTDGTDSRAYFFRAAVRIELERLEDARDDLLDVVALGGMLQQRGQWNLANVHLMLENADEALAVLATLADGEGAFKDVAAELAAEVRAATR